MTFFQVMNYCVVIYVDLSPDCDLILSKPISSGSTLIHSMTNCRTTERNIYIYMYLVGRMQPGQVFLWGCTVQQFKIVCKQ
jgi:hypothetical protein